MALDDQKREKIGIAKVSNVGTVDIYYVGGSTFELVMPNNKTKPLKFPKAKLDEYIGRGAVILSSQRRYNEICAAIHSDGSTDAHNADGTPKTEARKIFEELESEGFIPSDDAIASYIPTNAEPPSDNASNFNNTTGDDVGSYATPVETDAAASVSGNVDPFNLHSTPPQQSGDTPGNVTSSPFEGVDGTPDSLHTEPEVVSEPVNDLRDVNGDGVVDEFDDLQAEMRAKSPLLIAATTVVLVITCVAFFGFYILIHGIIGGNEISFDFDGSDEAQIVETVEANDEETDTDEADSTSTSNLTNRTDFDPEDAVADYPLASDDQETTVIGLFQALRAAVNSGEVTTYYSLIAIDSIAETIASAYASYAQTVQGLTDVQTEELHTAYAEQFVLNECEHVVGKDLYATFVGGRLREVRVDPNDNNTLYAVMESIAGDHQRICFIVTGSNDSYAITGVMDADGYVKMIASGNTSSNTE